MMSEWHKENNLVLLSVFKQSELLHSPKKLIKIQLSSTNCYNWTTYVKKVTAKLNIVHFKLEIPNIFENKKHARTSSKHESVIF